MAKTSARQPVRRSRRPSASAPAPAATRRPAPAAPAATEDRFRPPFLKATDVGHAADLELIPGTVRSMRGKFGGQILIDVRCHGKLFTWGIGMNTPNLRLVLRSLLRYPGEPVTVGSMAGRNGGSFIAVTDVDADQNGQQQPELEDAPF